jgi:oligoendopeptidase F
MTEATTQNQVRWDLTALFVGLEDPRIAEVWEQAQHRATRFAESYRGQIDSPNLNAVTLLEALGEIESITVEIAKPLAYANLIFSTDSGDPTIGAFFQKQRELATQFSVQTLFFELELQKASPEVIEPILADPALEPYRHYIESTRKYQPHRLSEAEEVVLEETANTGSRAWVRLFEEVTANHVFKLQLPGEEIKDATEPEVLALLRDADRGKRLAAAASLTAGLRELSRVITFTYNNLLQDKAVEDRLRKFDSPESSRHLANELDAETVDLVIRMCRANYGLVARYYRVKRQVLGLPELTHVDRYAPLFDTEESVSWEEGKAIVLDAFGRFSETMKAKAQEFFDANWIDAEPRKGKQGGAYCSYTTPDLHPFVFMNYLNRMDDVMTLAHELGHGVHASLSRKQSYFNFHGTLPLAELASTFGEMLVFEQLVANANSKDKLALYADKIEGVFATVFRQAAMFAFEQQCHRARRSEGELSSARFAELWHTELQAMFGDSVTMGEDHRIWWSYVGHFFFAPFYVYAYSFGELLALSLYERAKHAGAEFESKYLHVLELGGSKTPHDLMAIVDVDLRSEAFWQGGFDVIERLVESFEALWADYSKAS